VAATHGGLIADFLLNIAPSAELAQLSPAFAAQPYAGEVMRNGAITVVEYRGDGAPQYPQSQYPQYEVKVIAHTEHLLT
jgi:hypothetical protein